MERRGGIVLAGGRSSRMGTPKATLPWHGSTLLRRVVGLVARGVDGPVVVVRAPGGPLPPLPAGVEVVEDAEEGRGPLAGLLAGLEALEGRAEVAFLSAVDVPLLHPALVRHVLAAVDGADVALPEAHGHRHPLAAAYRLAVRPRVAALLAADRLRPAFLLEEVAVRRLAAEDLLADPALAAADPALTSLANLNTPLDYDRAHGEPEPLVAVERYGTLRPREAPRSVEVRAASVGRAAAAVGVPLDGHVVAAVNGDRISADPEVPLAAGDTVALLSAEAGG